MVLVLVSVLGRVLVDLFKPIQLGREAVLPRKVVQAGHDQEFEWALVRGVRVWVKEVRGEGSESLQEGKGRGAGDHVDVGEG